MTTPAPITTRRTALAARVATTKRSLREAQASLIEVAATGTERHKLRVALRLWAQRAQREE